MRREAIRRTDRRSVSVQATGRAALWQEQAEKRPDWRTKPASERKALGFVDAGKDSDFGKPAPKYKIQTAPFYAAWATPVIHDTRSGLRINARCQVVDMNGEIIAGLYCGGESAGGFSLHGLARCTVQGRIAGRNAAAETVKG